MESRQQFFDNVVRRAVETGKLVIETPPKGGPPRLWWVQENGSLYNIMVAQDLAGELGCWPGLCAGPECENMTAPQRVQTERDRVSIATSAFNARDFWARDRKLTVDRVVQVPSIIWSGKAYYSPPKGWYKPGRVYSSCDPIDASRKKGLDALLRIFDCLRLDDGQRARLVAFYAGALLRRCFPFMPGLMCHSPYKRTGKTVMCSLAGMILLDTHAPPLLTWSGDAEIGKEMASIDSGVYIIDNVDARDGRFWSPKIAAAVTAGSVAIRKLRMNEMVMLNDPIVAVSMQGGAIAPDLLDRFLHVELLHRRMENNEDIGPLAMRSYPDIRAELAALIFQTTPLEKCPTMPPHFRYEDFFRHVAPVVERAGYDPMLIADKTMRAVGAESVQLFDFMCKLAEEDHKPRTAGEILDSMSNLYQYPALLLALPPHTGRTGRLAHLETLLGDMPERINKQSHDLVLHRAQKQGEAAKYLVVTEPTPKEV